MLRLDARDTLGVLLAVEDAGVVKDLQALETALAAVDAGGVDAQGVRLLGQEKAHTERRPHRGGMGGKAPPVCRRR